MASAQHTKKYCVGVLAVCIVISFCIICPATASSMPIDQSNPNNNYTICSNDKSIAYTEEFKKTYIPQYTIEFNDYYYLNQNKVQEINPKFILLDRYIRTNVQYLLENPHSKILLKPSDKTTEQCIAESYTDRDIHTYYKGDSYLQSFAHPNTNLVVSFYIKQQAFDGLYYSIKYNDFDWVGISNNQFPDKTINKIYGNKKLEQYTPEFLISKNTLKNTIHKTGKFYYTTKPDITTIFNYIFDESNQLINTPESSIYLNLDNHGTFLNREKIAYSRKLDPNDNTTPETSKINTIIKKKNSLPQQLLINRTPGTYNPIGVFIDLEKINALENEIKSLDFGWISTYNYKQAGWIDTIWGPTYTPKPLNDTTITLETQEP